MNDWTRQQIAELTRLWGENLTTAEIGARLGISKSAVTGKAHRLNLPPRPSPIKRFTKEERETRRHAQAVARGERRNQAKSLYESSPEKLPSRATRPTTNPAKVAYYRGMGLSGASCHWPLGEPRTEDFHYCGEPAVNGKPYCADHCAEAYVIVRVNGRPASIETEDQAA